MLEGWGVQGRGRIKGENWENCNSIINKIYFKKSKLGCVKSLALSKNGRLKQEAFTKEKKERKKKGWQLLCKELLSSS